jgi:hypothetical protein
MYGKKGWLPGILILASLVLLILNILKDGSIYGIISNILLIIAMVLVLIANKKKKEEV